MTTPAGPPHLADELRETREQLAATSEILTMLADTTTSSEDVFGTIVERARALCRADVAQIHLVHDSKFVLTRSFGASPEYRDYAARRPVPRDRTSLIGRVSLDRTTLQIADVLADPDYDRPVFQRLGRIRTIMGAPMVVRDQVVGVLSVWRTTVDPFDDRAGAVLTSFATQGAMAIRTVELLRSLEARSAELGRRVDQLEALAEVGEAVSSSLDADEVLGTIVTTAVQLSGTDGGSLMEFDEDSRLFRVRTAIGTPEEVVEALRDSRIHIDETLVGRACLARTPTQVPDLDAVERDLHLEVLYAAGWRSLLAIPLLRADRVVGALVVRRRRAGAFGEETCEVLEAFASQSAIALTNARLYQELEQQSAALAEASRHKSEFLASMSHELRTPLNAVIGFSEVLLERMFGDLNERQEDYLRDILGSGRHLLALLNDVLDLSKVEAGQMELDRTDFEVEPAIGYVLAMIRERASDHRITVRTEVSDDVGTVRADELRFKQVLLNLLSNAIKFTPDGGHVAVTARVVGGELEMTVADTGIGIAVQDQQRIFDSFQQGARAARRVEGTGLGLTLTKRIVELHGGRMWLTSELGHGSTFGFSLPLHEAAPAQATDGTTLAARDGRPVAVVIEDDPSSAELLSLHLGTAGLHPVTRGSGPEGLEAVRALRPDVVILDIRLPGMDGWDVLTAIKGDPATADVPVVVVSVLPDRGRGIALGASDYLVKPVAREDLIATLGRLLQPADDGSASGRVAVHVDDDPTALELVRQALQPAGWTVHACQRVDDALTLVRAHNPTVVLVDLLMPETDGFAMVDLLRSDPVTAAVPVVVLTTKTLTSVERRLLEGRIEFVASKSAVDLRQLALRLAGIPVAVAARPRRRRDPS
ncbi:hypothetical protein GCM10027517_17560 [Phycicoccus ginsengisoli]